MLYPDNYRTQKARGIASVAALGVFPNYYLGTQEDNVLSKSTAFPAQQQVTLPAFARPCPTVPRHGFVESRVVRDTNDVLAVIAETLKEDPNGEVVFMPQLTGHWSGVVTHAGVTFGRSNDGATAGRSARVVPAWSAPRTFRAYVGEGACSNAGIHDSPYIEFVENDGRVAIVQLRDGPAVPRSANFIPEPTVVATVLTVNPAMDLLAWEREIESVAGQPGVVVYHPGGSLSSHFAVHAITHNIPVVIDHRPHVGETLQKPSDTPKPLRARDYRYIAENLRRRLEAGFGNLTPQRHAVQTAIATLHASPMWGREPHLNRLRAEGVAAALVFVGAACLGEDRHWYEDGPGQMGKRPKCKAFEDLGFDIRARGVSRHRVFEEVLEQPYRRLHRWVGQAAKDFDAIGWNRAYGGRSWSAAAHAAEKGLEHADKFIAKPSTKTWQALMASYNEVVNASHNNGRVLNKWVSSMALDAIAEAPAPGFVNPHAARVVLGLQRLSPAKDAKQGLLTAPELEAIAA